MQLDHKLSPQDRPENNNFDLLENESVYMAVAQRGLEIIAFSVQCTAS